MRVAEENALHVSQELYNTLSCNLLLGVTYTVYTVKDVRQLVTAERHLPPKCTNFGFFTTICTNFGFFTTKVYEF